ncbi:uncharacterized protein MONOS_12313 [Monocercomonoides exilis]|uniref:uncharacterized protein n=1 Tax=Monocercomonoides exilis TaxID=2049356 RepID=UPI00355AA7F8|nr:hypothetical protein MONOS_12313 [Monocercomonoides exilis]|eukprot:MONOS_12313.1-p1 / transcript=MONOS_12313.1 / gene=MONOS_12313 / organism=Monocercomonoides_exilis_PA203 / gene_product=unspecified product / transcript_product=unspecified product / location=Mono_scaffold00674:22347-23748(+) / protein_length=262 / sequence_SO=supercontig / SO=protein_coding / is_pseudo=false
METPLREYVFSLRFESKWGQNCYVIGEGKELGCWRPNPSLRMIYTAKAFWTIKLQIPDTNLRYTYVVLDDFDPSKTILWEPRIDRELKKGQIPNTDDWGVGRKVQEIILPVIEKPIWRCPMPISRMFDPAGTIREEFEALHFDVIVILAHKEELEYHTNRQLLPYYESLKIPIHVYEVDDMSVPPEFEEYGRLVNEIIDLIKEGKRVCVHCHSGTGRTGLFIACIWKKLTKKSAKEILEQFNDTFHGALLTSDCLHYLHHFQ